MVMQKMMRMGICLGVFIAAGLNFASMARVEAHEQSSEELGFSLENNFFLAVLNNEVKDFSRMISKIFQGQIIGQTFDRTEYIDYLTNLNLQSFGIQDLIAKRKRNILTVSFTMTSTDINGTHTNFFVSVWQKIAKHEKHLGHVSSVSSSDGEKWLLVSTSNFPSIEALPPE